MSHTRNFIYITHARVRARTQKERELEKN